MAAVAVVGALALSGCSLLPRASANDDAEGDAVAVAEEDAGAVVPVIECPSAEELLTDVPEDAQDEVATELGNLANQIAAAQARLDVEFTEAQAVAEGDEAAGEEATAQFLELADSVLADLSESKRPAALSRIEIAIDRVGGEAPDLSDLAECSLNAEDEAEDGEGDEGEEAEEGEAEAEDAEAEDEAEEAEDEAEEEDAEAGDEGEEAEDEDAEGDEADENEAIDCEDVEEQIANANVPAAAVSLVQEQVQIIEQNVSLADQAAVDNKDRSKEWLEENVVEVLVDVRIEIVNRIEIAVAINGGEIDPELEKLAGACELKVV